MFNTNLYLYILDVHLPIPPVQVCITITSTYNSRLDTIVTIVAQLDVVQCKEEISHASLKLVVPTDYSI